MFVSLTLQKQQELYQSNADSLPERYPDQLCLRGLHMQCHERLFNLFNLQHVASNDKLLRFWIFISLKTKVKGQ